MRTRTVLTALICVVSASIASALAPNAPLDLSATVSASTVTLTWAAPGTGDAPAGYIVFASLSPSGPAIATLPVSATTLTVSNVADGIYYVHVRAANNEGISAASNEVMVVVPGGSGGCALPPTAPTNLSGTTSGNQVTLAWTPAAAGCPATAYVVQAGSATGLSDVAVINVGGTTTLSAAAPPGTYFVRVLAVNAAGGSAPSAEIVITVTPAGSSRVAIGFDGLPERGEPITDRHLHRIGIYPHDHCAGLDDPHQLREPGALHSIRPRRDSVGPGR